MNLPWHYYASVWSWLRHGLIVKWHCADCGKRHISGTKYWSDHIDFDVPLCTECQHETWVGYQAHELSRLMEDSWRLRDWATMNLICDELEKDPELAAAYDHLIDLEIAAQEDSDFESEWALDGGMS